MNSCDLRHHIRKIPQNVADGNGNKVHDNVVNAAHHEGKTEQEVWQICRSHRDETIQLHQLEWKTPRPQIQNNHDHWAGKKHHVEKVHIHKDQGKCTQEKDVEEVTRPSQIEMFFKSLAVHIEEVCMEEESDPELIKEDECCEDTPVLATVDNQIKIEIKFKRRNNIE